MFFLTVLYIFSGGVTGAFDSSGPVPDEAKLIELYKLFGIDDPPRDGDSKLINPYHLSQQFLEKSLKNGPELIDLCLNDQ